MGFGLVIEFIRFFDTQLVTTRYRSRLHTQYVLSHGLRQSSGNGFQRRMFPFLWVPELSKCLKHSNSQLSHQQVPNCYYALLRRLTVDSRLTSNSSWPSLYNHCPDRTENTAFSSSSYCCVTRTSRKQLLSVVVEPIFMRLCVCSMASEPNSTM
jgi:hypothetical protein